MARIIIILCLVLASQVHADSTKISQGEIDTFAADTTVASMVYHKTIILLDSGNVSEAKKELCGWLNIQLISLGEVLENTGKEHRTAALSAIKTIQKQKSSCYFQPSARATLDAYGQ